LIHYYTIAFNKKYFDYFFVEAKMKYINKLGDASKAQGLLKRALKIQDVCKDKYKNNH